MMALEYGIMNVALIYDSDWSGVVPVAASVSDSSSVGISTGTTGEVPAVASSSARRGTGRLGSVADLSVRDSGG